MPIRPLLCLVLLAGVTLAGDAANPPPNPATGPITRGQRILAVHHSFHAGAFYDILLRMADSAGVTGSSLVGNHYLGGSTVMNHWDNGVTGKAAKESLATGQVDVLTTTPIYLPDPGIENFAQLGFQHNPNLRMTVMEFWLPFDNYEPGNYLGGAKHVNPPKTVDHEIQTGESLAKFHAPYFKEMDEQIRAVNAKLGKPVILAVPVGQAVIALRELIRTGKAPGLKHQKDLFSDQLGHPNAPLSVMMAYCHFAVIYRRSPVGLPAPKELGPNAEALNRLLQDLAWDAVTHHPLSGIKPPKK